MNIKEVVKEAYNEVVKELEMGMGAGPDTQVIPSKRDSAMGNVSSQLATAKGELATVLDKAERAGIISKKNGKITINNTEQYMKYIGDLPRRIKTLQQKLEPDLMPDDED
jgi:hypothetical protein